MSKVITIVGLIIVLGTVTVALALQTLSGGLVAGLLFVGLILVGAGIALYYAENG
ncbi:MAG: hypothetical protein LBT21_02720 [Oscillospiraceae bacterium]|jgi:hypothetical protein|nr:hypothetical protein [Oscillospiraceae bacterium]